MLLLTFRLGHECYALDASCVVEILPLVSIKKMLRPPKGIVGTISYRGTLVPVVDLSEHVLDHPATPHLSTRIIVIRSSPDLDRARLLGLIAEKTTETRRCEVADLVPGIASADAPYLGGVVTGPRGLIQLIDASKLLPDLVLEGCA